MAPGRAGVGGQDCPPQNFGDFLGRCDGGMGCTQVPTDSCTFMMPAGRNHRKHPMVSDPYNGPITTSIPTRKWECLEAHYRRHVYRTEWYLWTCSGCKPWCVQITKPQHRQWTDQADFCGRVPRGGTVWGGCHSWIRHSLCGDAWLGGNQRQSRGRGKEAW